MCLWSINVPAGKSVLLEFLKFDVENDTLCNSDQLAVFAGRDRLIGKFCGHQHPSPILVSLNSVTLQFVSDFSISGTGFSVKFMAVDPHSEHASGCGTVAVLQSEGIVQSLCHPDLYGNNSDCRWVIHAPPGHVVKLAFNDFDVEPARECMYDSLTIFGDVEGKEEIATLCGRTLPPPVLSYENVMMLQFTSDGSMSHRGFHANVSFISMRDLHQEEPVEPEEKFGDEASVPPYQKRLGLSTHPLLAALSRVLGGEEAVPHSWPWQVRLSLGSKHICGGAIVRTTWVLTSAHCLYGLEREYTDLLTVIAGDHNLSTREPQEQRRTVRRITPHPHYNDSTLDNDVALLQLNTPLMFNEYVRSICLPRAGQEAPPSHLCTVSGWGSQIAGEQNKRMLQQLEVPVLGRSECESLYPGRLTPTMLCAGFPQSEGQDTCMGDSGGPLVCQSEDSSYWVYGVTSWGQGCGKFQKPGVYASVPVLKDWILQQLESSISEEGTNESEPRVEPQQADWTLNDEIFLPEASGAD
ncbi:hypothetical protein MATL_G00098720 [Megalops atlanticus]|uniref:Ovochymase-2 n=1 Tax=Megalops atlanticus TaxID=7932 RepID=A0A9D3Q1C8_MEGAT|nr:hypothetical protein MATL_G00098720 [Megalops atlanticus]